MAAALSRALKLPGKKHTGLGEYDPLTQADSDESEEEEEEEDELVLNFPRNGFNGSAQACRSTGLQTQGGNRERAAVRKHGRLTGGPEARIDREPGSDPELKDRAGRAQLIRTTLFLATLCVSVLVVLMCAFLIPCRKGALWPKHWNRSVGEMGVVSLPPLELWDVDNDTVTDVVIATTQPANDSSASLVHSVSALSGIDGALLWTRSVLEEARFIQCGFERLGRGSGPACLLTGTSALLRAVRADTGSSLWQLSPQALEGRITAPALRVPDLNADSVPELLVAVRPADQQSDLSLLLVSGADGAVIGSRVTFNLTGQGKPIGPQLHVTKGGAIYILFGFGSVEATSLKDIFLQANRKATPPRALLSQDPDWEKLRGENLSSLIHVASGHVEYLASLSGSTLSCNDLLITTRGSLSFIRGSNLQRKWSIRIPRIQSPPVFGFFNKDDIPDIMLQVSTADGLKKVLVIDGSSGRSLWQAEFCCHLQAVGGTALATSTGQSAFLFWADDLRPSGNATSPNPESLVLHRLYLLHSTYPTILLELMSSTDTILSTGARYVEQQKDAFYITVATRPAPDSSSSKTGAQVVSRLSLKRAVTHASPVALGPPSQPLGPFEVANFFNKLEFIKTQK
ncbi:protein FAM234B-like isoform X1 [Acipenser ruthenus]|uniref:protein FAM234B-like isoform X1 n=1 Tax=Acipenser ruthenus TaxID=7906 RepID=UPI0027417143|nr:protein FAM234B-like isoform X1 [Acipenser ruthenus]